jgi:hypothetical protein
MPTQTVWADPELFLEHGGVQVFHTYQDDNMNQGRRRYWLTVNTQCGVADSLCEDQPCRHVFDVRQLSTWRPLKEPPHDSGPQDTPENRALWTRYWEQEANIIQTAVITAIDRRELSTRGWRSDGSTPGS